MGAAFVGAVVRASNKAARGASVMGAAVRAALVGPAVWSCSRGSCCVELLRELFSWELLWKLQKELLLELLSW